MDYKNTLLIPKTDFEMRANLSIKEPNIAKQWEDNKITKKVLDSNKNQKQFFLHDGPPYANGNLHLGHALNKILKDFIIRYNNNIGNYSPFICGWDTHGLPIENAILKNKKIKIDGLTVNEIQNLCKEYALAQVESQIIQFKRLGLLTDFNQKYLTLEPEYELEQLKLFSLMCQKKLVYRDMKPVHWSPSSKSALAEAEIEYKSLTSKAIYVAFSVVRGNSKVPANTKVIIWTTTPWTIPANLLLAIGETIQYSIFEYDGDKYLVASDLVETICKKLDFAKIKIIDKVLGKDLVNIDTLHPLYERKSKIVIGHHVQTNVGTGIVHIAPGFGEDDYIIGKNNNVNIFVPINDYGKFTSEVNDLDLENLFYEKSNDIIIQKLKNNQKLLYVESYTHQYPVDWRTKKPVIFRAVKQWFVSIEKIRADLIKQIEKNIVWKQPGTITNMLNMIKDRSDWCISRQRTWGVPIIAFYDQNHNPQISAQLVDYVIDIIKKHGIDVWYNWDCDKLLPIKYRNLNWTKEKDIIDVWFDSGISHLYMKSKFGFNVPFDLYLEGRDQFRGWFNSSLITSVIKYNKSPYKSLLTHGFIVDENGYKMSKSAGNGVELMDICNSYGADVLRLWVASVDYSDDVRFGKNIMQQISDSYRKIRNTIRFILGNLSDFNFSKNQATKLMEVDNFILYKAKIYKEKVQTLFQNYNFNAYYLATLNFISNDLSAFYLDFIKDILYIEKCDSLRRRQVQTTLYYILETLLDVLKPVLVYTTEEAYGYFNKQDKQKSIFLEKWKNTNVKFSANLLAKWEKVIKFRNDVNKCLELARENKQIKKSLETKVSIFLKSGFEELKTIPDLAQILIVSELIFVNDKSLNQQEFSSAFISVEVKDGKKCQRCWKIVNNLVNDEICDKCYSIVNDKGSDVNG